MTHEEILAMLGDYVNYLIANSSAEAPMWNIEKVRSGKPNKWNYIDGCMKPHRDAAQRNRDVALNNCKKEESLHQQTFLLFPVLYI